MDAEPVEKRLFEVKGKRNIKIRQVNIEGANVCKSDCWILDQGKDGKILVYMPPGASKMEQFKATHAANQIRDEDHAGSATVEILSMLILTLQMYYQSVFMTDQIFLPPSTFIVQNSR